MTIDYWRYINILHVHVSMYVNRDFQSISRFISEMIKKSHRVTIECQLKTVFKLSNDTIVNNIQ